jgi:hypothetical protein
MARPRHSSGPADRGTAAGPHPDRHLRRCGRGGCPRSKNPGRAATDYRGGHPLRGVKLHVTRHRRRKHQHRLCPA